RSGEEFPSGMSQELSEGETELEARAFDLFLKKNFEEAKPLFSQLLSLYPKEANYNFGYGVCLIETNDDIEKAIKYLIFASMKSDNPVIYFYLGRGYHLGYKFDEALENYGSFKSNATATELKEYEVNMFVDMAKNGKTLIRYISDLIVIDNKKINLENFHYSYELNDFGGKLIVKPPEFQTKVDQKLGHGGLMFLSDSGYVYFSSYGSDKKGSKDIYRSKKQADGSWGVYELLGTEINTQYDEDYPYIHTDNKTLYFSSKGHNSMGGYDVFRTVYDNSTGKWSVPVNLDFPTNSPFDDILYISDAKEDFAYFASNRETSGEKISVFKIEVDKNPIEREIKSYDEVIQKSKLEISPLAMRTNKDQQNLVDNNNQSNNNSTTKNQNNFNFSALSYSNNLTINDLLSESVKDTAIVNEDIENTQKQSDLAYIMADEKNKNADQKRIEAEKIRQTDSQKAEKLIKEADVLDDEAIAAYNIAKVLENSAKEKEKDAENMKIFAEKISSGDEQNVEVLYNELINNREFMNKSVDKYSDIETEIKIRENMVDSKDNEIAKKNLQVSDLKRENEKIINEINASETKLNSTKSENEKSIINEDIASLKDELEANKQKELKATQNINKLEIEKKNINNELAIFKTQKTVIENNEVSNEKINENLSAINKENLKKDIFEKELIADKNKAEELLTVENKVVKDNTSDNNINNNSSDNTIIENNDVENVENVNNANNKTENKYQNIKSEKAIALIKSADKDKKAADSLNVIADEKRFMYNQLTDQSEKSKLEDEIRELDDLALIKKQQSDKKKNEARIAEQQYLAENKNVETNNSNQLYNEARKNKNISDSLYYLADIKRKELSTTEDSVRITFLTYQIKDLEELAEIKKNKSDEQFKQSGIAENNIADSYISYQEDLIDNNPVFSFGNNEVADTKVKQYEKELFNTRYFENLAVSQEKKLEAMKNVMENVDDELLKKNIQKDIDNLQKLVSYSKKAADESNTLAESLKDQASDEVNNSDVSSEYLLVKATEYQPKNNFELSKIERETLGFTSNDRKFADDGIENWFNLKKEVDELRNSLNTTKDDSEKKKIQKKITDKEINLKELFTNINSIYQEANDQEYGLYESKLENLHFVSTNEEVVLANNLEKEAGLFFEKAKLIRENADIIEDADTKNQELIKAKNLEIIAMQKQKHAIDLFIDHADQKDQVFVAENNNTSNNNVNPENASNNKNITLLPEEEKQLVESRKEQHIANTLETEAKTQLEEIKLKKEQATNTYNTSDKNKLLKGIDKKEIEANNTLEKAYNSYGKSDSLKYNLYKNQISEMHESLKDVGYNKQIAKQFMNEADFYYNQGRDLRKQAEKIENQDQRVEVLARALEFENKALSNQEIAVDVLLNVDPVDFANANTLTKVDRLEVLNQPVNTERIKEIQSKAIFENTEMPEKDLKAMDDIKNMEKIVEGWDNDIMEIKEIINDQQNIIATSDDKKVQNKAKKTIEKQDKILLATLFSKADLIAQINDTRYWVYKENIENYRTKGNSDEARQGRQLEKDANTDYNKAKSYRDKSFFIENPDVAYDMLVKADSLEKEAVSDMEKAYSVYLGIQVTDTMLLAENTNDDKNSNNLIVKNNADISPVDNNVVTDNVVKDTVIVDNTDNTDVVDNTDNTDVVDNTDNTDVVDNTDNTDVVDNTDNTDVVDNTDNTDIVDNTDNTDVVDNTDNTDVVDNTDNTDV
ncbi:MAG: hypothetical protein ABIJ97_12255, partial [Bacteroidota bacterium]